MYNIIVALINAACESGGTGRRARLRGVWETVRVRFPSLAPTKKTESIDSAFFVGIRGEEFNPSLERLAFEDRVRKFGERTFYACIRTPRRI